MTNEERKYQHQRAQLARNLRSKGIEDERVLDAFATVPRHEFIEPALRNRAYADEALPIGMRQTISQPFTVAYQTMMLGVKPGDRVLEVGTGSGYQAAILCEMGVRVFTIERHKPLQERAKRLLGKLGYRIVARHGDGTQGWPAFAPYDGIIVTAGTAEVPSALLDQLRVASDKQAGGRLVIPLGGEEGQTMNRITRTGPDAYEREETHGFRFVPLVSEEDDR